MACLFPEPNGPVIYLERGLARLMCGHESGPGWVPVDAEVTPFVRSNAPEDVEPAPTVARDEDAPVALFPVGGARVPLGADAARVVVLGQVVDELEVGILREQSFFGAIAGFLAPCGHRVADDFALLGGEFAADRVEAGRLGRGAGGPEKDDEEESDCVLHVWEYA